MSMPAEFLLREGSPVQRASAFHMIPRVMRRMLTAEETDFARSRSGGSPVLEAPSPFTTSTARGGNLGALLLAALAPPPARQQARPPAVRGAPTTN